ncbi:MAG: hypothetical protein KDB27_07995 [Planctomycetales bacterium]|nr:hypothetical protein [Planctomycetales bacterium]
MTTPLIILTLLILPWIFALCGQSMLHRDRRFAQSGAIVGVTAVFVFTGIGHFIKTMPMSEMIPSFVPMRIAIVYCTGVLEVVLAVAVLFPSARKKSGVALVLLLVAFLPINIFAAFQRVEMGGHSWGPVYLLIRVPLQVILVAWTWHFVVRGDKESCTVASADPAN